MITWGEINGNQKNKIFQKFNKCLIAYHRYLVDSLTCVSYYKRPFVHVWIRNRNGLGGKLFLQTVAATTFFVFLEINLDLNIIVLFLWVCKHLYEDNWRHLSLCIVESHGLLSFFPPVLKSAAGSDDDLSLKMLINIFYV